MRPVSVSVDGTTRPHVCGAIAGRPTGEGGSPSLSDPSTTRAEAGGTTRLSHRPGPDVAGVFLATCRKGTGLRTGSSLGQSQGPCPPVTLTGTIGGPL